MMKRILALLLLFVNLINAPKALNNLKNAINGSDAYSRSSGFTYFVLWLVFFGLIFWLWKSGKKQTNET